MYEYSFADNARDSYDLLRLNNMLIICLYFTKSVEPAYAYKRHGYMKNVLQNIANSCFNSSDQIIAAFFCWKSAFFF